MLTSRFSSYVLPLGLVGVIGIAIYAEYFLGKTFTSAVVASITTLLLLFHLLRTKVLLVPKKSTLIFLLFLLWMVIVTPFSSDITSSMWEVIRTVSLLFTLLLAYNIGEKKVSLFLLVFLTLSFILLIFDVASFILQGGIGLRSLTGIFSWHNQMAGFLLFILPPLLTFIWITKERYKRIVLLILLGLTFMTMLLTLSRGGLVILISQVFLFAYLVGSQKKKILSVVLVTCLFGVVFILALKPTVFIENITSIPRELTNDRTTSGNFRISTWNSSIEMITSFPLSGTGPGTFGSVFATFQNEPWLFAQNAHNHILQIATENGLIGMFLFILFLAVCTRTIIRKEKNIPRAQKILLTGLVVGLTGSFLHSLIDYDLSTVSLSTHFFLYLGLSLLLTDKNPYKFVLHKTNTFIYAYLFIFLCFVLVLEVSEDRYQTARFALEDGYPKQSYDSIQTSLTLNPYNGKSYILASDIMYRSGQHDYASWYAEKGIQLLPYDHLHYTLLGAIEAEKNNFSKAIMWYEKSIQTKPYASPNQYLGLAYSYKESGDIQQAEKILDRAVHEIFPTNITYKDSSHLYYANGLTNDLASLYIYLGDLKLQLGKDKEAENIFKTVKNELTPPENSFQIRRNDVLE